MKIGILADCFGLGFEEGIKKAAQMGVHGVQLYAVEGELAPENMSAEKRAWAKNLVKENGLVVSAICGDLGEGGFAFEDRNADKIAYTKKIVDLAIDLDCHIITTHIGVVPADPSHPRFEVIAKALKELGAYAESKGATFAIETGPEPARDLRRMLDYVGSKGVGVNLDPANLIMSTFDDPVQAVYTLKDYIVHTHAKDGVFYKPCDMDIMYGMVPAPEGFNEWDYCAEVPLGEGQVKWESYLNALRDIGYNGFLTIERECGEDPAKDIQLAIDFLTLQDDEYANTFLRNLEIKAMPESFKAQQGQRTLFHGQQNLTFRSPRNSFVQINLAVTSFQTGELLVEERPSFSHRYPMDMHQVVRAAIYADGLNARLHLVDMVEDDDGIKKADVVLNSGSMPICAYQMNQLTALIDVPETVKPGVYEGRICFYAHSMFYDERLAREIPFTITVEETTLPKAKDGKFYLNLWQHVFNIARKHEVTAYTDEHLEALRPYCKALGELGNKVVTVLLSDIPWAGQRCWTELYNPSDLYEYNYVRIRRTKEGKFVYDFSFAEKYIALMKEYGATDVMFTGLYGLWEDSKNGFGVIVNNWPDAIRVSYIDEKNGAIRFMREREEIEDYLAALYQWMKDSNLLETSYLMGDEVDLGGKTEGWTSVLETLHKLLPNIRRDWDMLPSVLMSDTYKDERVDIYTPQIDGIPVEDPAVWQAAMDKVEAGGKKLWSVCCWPPVMNSFLYTNLNEVRLHGLITEHIKMDGFIRWNFTVWPNDPRTSLRFFAPGWPAGDTCFVYPGKGGQCLKSLRYLALRRGIEDFELCQLVKEKCENADEIINRAMACVLPEMDVSKWDFADFHGRTKYMSHENDDYQKARNILLDALKEA